ncbi:hypothetical protein AURDEDRAFT_128793 [Auricularia subglabra TFB-10046 SS5]|nr:hypothetical protein AURDEDRAFT_128793 [Auricularia subglabra TFB-10046 SS5]
MANAHAPVAIEREGWSDDLLVELVDRLRPLAATISPVPRKYQYEIFRVISGACSIRKPGGLANRLSTEFRKLEREIVGEVPTMSTKRRRSHLLKLAQATGCRAPKRLTVSLDKILAAPTGVWSHRKIPIHKISVREIHSHLLEPDKALRYALQHPAMQLHKSYLVRLELCLLVFGQTVATSQVFGNHTSFAAKKRPKDIAGPADPIGADIAGGVAPLVVVEARSADPKGSPEVADGVEVGSDIDVSRKTAEDPYERLLSNSESQDISETSCCNPGIVIVRGADQKPSWDGANDCAARWYIRQDPGIESGSQGVARSETADSGSALAAYHAFPSG